MNEPEWLAGFTEREKREIDLACLYARDFAHGTDGHGRLLLIAKLVAVIKQMEAGRRGDGGLTG